MSSAPSLPSSPGDGGGEAGGGAADGGAADEVKLTEWRKGMALMAALPQVHVKLSMLGYSVPGWHADAAKEAHRTGL